MRKMLAAAATLTIVGSVRAASTGAASAATPAAGMPEAGQRHRPVNATTTDFSRPFAMHLARNEVASGKPLQIQVRHLQFRTGEKTLPARQLWGAVFGELN